MSCIFTNDNNVEVKLVKHRSSRVFATRDNHEIMFRRINTFLINKKKIQKNIIDLGGWIGDNSIPWAMNLPESIIYCIDPSGNNIRFIKDMCALNRITNVKTIQVAVSDKIETLTTNGNINHCSFVYNNPHNNGKHKEYAVTLDSLHDDKDIENIGMIHLDVEGMEYKVMKGGELLIDKYLPIISYEQHLEIDDTEIIKKFLKNKKYIIYMINEILPGCRKDCRNMIAFPEHIHTEELIKEINEEFLNILVKI
tara:strand:+ start:467 stop:1225 length:759 start_codon:yes stop_codon:yes gene_type:complete